MVQPRSLERDLIKMVFAGTDPAWRPTAGQPNLYLALHTALPGVESSQATYEVSYGGYARVPISRDGSGWTVSGGQVSNAALVQFPVCTGGSTTATHFSIGTTAGISSEILYRGPLNAGLAISRLKQPQFAPGALIIAEE